MLMLSEAQTKVESTVQPAPQNTWWNRIIGGSTERIERKQTNGVRYARNVIEENIEGKGEKKSPPRTSVHEQRLRIGLAEA